MQAEIITIGDELLLGQVVDTNSAWMGLKLADIGILVTRRTAVGDNENDIIQAITEARERVSIVLLTGGLGPTRDDITKKTLCKYFQCGYRNDTEVMHWLEEIFAKRGRKLLDVNRLQAELPEKCITLFNQSGTAPGMLFDEEGFILISMPGVPNEMKHIMEEKVLPWLPKKFALPTILHKTLLVIGIPESLLAEQLAVVEDALPANLKLAYLPSYSAIRLRLMITADSKEMALQEMKPYYEQIKEICADHLLAEGDQSPSHAIAELLIKRNIKISIAESCTGGFITNQLVQVPGISQVLQGGLVSYTNEIKMQELGVPPEIFTTVGAVSEACARHMVEGCLKKFNTDIAISTTGIAGPGGATAEKPVGLIFIGVANKHKTIVKKFQLPGTRFQFMERANNCAMDMVREVICDNFMEFPK